MKIVSIVLPSLCFLLLCACTRESSQSINERVADIRSERKPATQVVSVRKEATPLATKVSRVAVVSADPAFVALSADEQDWLMRNGFLTREELRNLQALGQSALLERSREKGDVAATTALGILRLREGDSRGAVIALDRAARSGSLYALEQLAFAELNDFQTGAGPRDLSSEQNALVQFSARMEQARIMGDHRVDYYIDLVASGLSKDHYGGRILQQTTEYMRQMAEDSATKGVRARAPDARPNIDQWQQIQANQSGVAEVILR